MSKSFWGVIVIIILLFVGIFAFTGKKSDTATKSSGAALTQHVQGPAKATVKLVEYGDYQCPFCGQYYPTIKQVQAEFGDQIQFQFRNYPLTNLHQNAFSAARAAEAAGLQNKYWEMHDALYQTQNSWSQSNDPTSLFNDYAKQLGLDVTKFKQDYISTKVNNLINADMAEGNRLKITGTPTFFLNGKQVQIANTVGSFEQVIKEALAKQAPTSAGTTTQTTKQ